MHARTLIGPQTIDGRSSFREQGAKSLIDPQLAQPPYLGDVILEIIDGIAELPTYELSLVSKSCSDGLFLRKRLSCHREFHLSLQVLDLDPGVRQMIVRPVEIKAFFAGSGINHR